MKYAEFVLRELKAGRITKAQALQLLTYAQVPSSASRARHPLLHSNVSDLHGQRYAVRFSGDEPFFHDHVIGGLRVLPGVVCLEMARAAIAAGLGEAATAIELRDVAWIRPIIAADDGVRELEIALQLGETGVVDFEVREAADPDIVHVQGCGAAIAMPADPDPLDIEALRAQCDRRIDADACYRIFDTLGMRYGPSHRGVAQIDTGRDATGRSFVLARVHLPDCVAVTRDDYTLHPSVLDSALQSGMALALDVGTSSDGASRPMLPFALDRLQVFGPTPAEAWVRIRANDGHPARGGMLAFDVDVCDDSGRVHVRLQGLTSRAAGEPEETWLLAPEWTPVPVGATVQAQSPERPPAPFGQRIVCLDARFAGAFDSLAAADDTVRWIVLPSADADAPPWAAWETLFATVRDLLADRPAMPVSLQYLVAREQCAAWSGHRGALAGAIAGVFKTASLENPAFRGQIVEVPADAGADLLSQVVRTEATLDAPSVRYREAGREIPSLVPVQGGDPAGAPWKRDGVYWITGGAGGLGAIVARDIARHARGATLILSGRSAPDTRTQALLDALGAEQATVEYRALDVADGAAVQACVDDIVSRHGSLTGIVHCAGVLADAFIVRKTVDELRAVWAPKVQGTVNLDRATRGLPLELFLLFSSAAGVSGGVGQGDYATANAFLDAYAHYRQACVQAGTAQGRTLAIDWPYWSGGGMRLDDDALQQLLGAGLAPLSEAAGLAALHTACTLDRPQLVVLHGQRSALVAMRPDPSARADAAGSVPAPAAADTEPAHGDLHDRAVHHLKRVLAQTLRLQPERIESDALLEKYGIDSVLALKIVSVLQSDFGNLPKTLMFEYRTLDALADYFIQRHPASLASCLGLDSAESGAARTLPAAAAPMPAPAALVRERLRRLPRSVAGTNTAAHASGTSVNAGTGVHDIAIVGVSGRFPQAPDLDAYWDNLRAGRDCVTEIPASRWDYRDFFDAEKGKAGTSYCKWGGFIDGVELFDALFFNISPREAVALDPQERLFLECVYNTLEDAGHTRESLRTGFDADTAHVGVFVGVMYEEYQLYGAQAQTLGEPYALSGSTASIANRISYYFDFHGPSLAIDTMCSSSLTAIHLACRSLRSGECAAAIAGGVNLSVHPNKFLAISQAQFASSRGRCESFGAHGDGYVPGEGVGAVLLKPMHRALADGDRIHGVIRGTSINHGGRTNGFSVPNPQAQANAIARAIEDAGVDARAIGYIEAHGTGTRLGDPIEIAGLSQAFARFTPDVGFCAIGSAKSNIGHLESAAGIAGLAKVLLQMRHGQLAPSLHADEPNPFIEFDRTPFVLQRTLADWPRPRIAVDGVVRELPRTAGLSSFGAGGANAHLVVQEYVDEDDGSWADAPKVDVTRGHIVLLSARSEDRLRASAQRLLDGLEAGRVPSHRLADLAYTLQVGREAMEHRLAFVAATLDEVVAHLRAYVADDGSRQLHRGEAKRQGSVALFNNDDELRQAVVRWIERGKYERLLELWVQGLAVPWARLHVGRTPRRLSLPTYPFAGERYWAASPRLLKVDAGAVEAPVVRSERILARRWMPAPVAVSSTAARPLLIVASDAAAALSAALQRECPGSVAVDVAGFDALPAERLQTFDVLVDLAVSAQGDGASIDGLAGLQRWVQTHMSIGGTVLCVTRGMYGPAGVCIDPAGALRAAVVRPLQSEYSRIVSRHLDLDADTDAHQHAGSEARAIIAELDVGGLDAQVRRVAGERFRAVLQEAPPQPGTTPGAWPEDGVLWITGGTRGIGYLCALHCARRRGVKRLWLTCREAFPPRAAWEALAREDSSDLGERIRGLLALEASGVRIHVSNPTLADAQAVARDIAAVEATLGPIAGVLHCAGRVDVSALAFIQKSPDAIRGVFEPKVAGLDVLLECLQDRQLCFAVLFSSVSAALPGLAAGQIDYAAANAYMDSRAEAAFARGMPIVSLQWPSWAQSGMGAVKSQAYERSGLLALSDEEGLSLLDAVLDAAYGGVYLPARVDTRRWRDDALAHALQTAAPTAARPFQAASARVSEAADGGLRAWLREHVSAHLGVALERLDDHTPLIDYGLDSVMLAQLLTPISRHVGEALDPSILYEHPTIDAFGQWLQREHGVHFQAPAAAGADSAAQTDAAADVPANVSAPAPRTREPAPAPVSGGSDIAIVGMACRFAGCATLDAYWRMLSEGRTAIAPVPAQRWGRASEAFAALLDDLDAFDPQFFRLSEPDARIMDPQARLVLEEALAAWHDAGYALDDVRGSSTGVYIGGRSQYRADEVALLLAQNPILSTGQNYLAANVSQFFDLRGPSLVVDTACSSALAAMDIAVQALQSGRLAAALVGGVNVLHTDGALRMFEHRGLLQRDGRFHVFDQRASGAILGEGVGMVVLKTLDTAMADGDRIYAVVKAIEVNNDGRTAGPSAPSMQAQVDVMRTALQRSGLPSAAIGHVEANAAGSQINDLLELKAIAAVYGTPERVCRLGSMKPNIGHPLCAEGIASFIKVALMLHHRRRVPFLSAEEPLPHFDAARAGLEFPRRLEVWDDAAPAAAINSFADGGTNAHVVLGAFDRSGYVPARAPLALPRMTRIDLSGGEPPPSPLQRPDAARRPRNFWKSSVATSH